MTSSVENHFYYFHLNQLLIDVLTDFISPTKINYYDQENRVSILKLLITNYRNFPLVNMLIKKELVISDIEGLNPYYYTLKESESTNFIIEYLLNLGIPLPKNYWSYVFKKISHGEIPLEKNYLLTLKDRSFIIDSDTQENVWDLVVKNKSYSLIEFIPPEFYKFGKDLTTKIIDNNTIDLVFVLKEKMISLFGNESDYLNCLKLLFSKSSNFELFLNNTPSFLSLAKSENSIHKGNKNLEMTLKLIEDYKISFNEVWSPIPVLKKVYEYDCSKGENDKIESNFINENIENLDSLIKLSIVRLDLPVAIRGGLKDYLMSIPNLNVYAPKQLESCYKYYNSWREQYNFLQKLDDVTTYINEDLSVKLINILDSDVFESLCDIYVEKITLLKMNEEKNESSKTKKEEVKKEEVKNEILLELVSKDSVIKFKKQHIGSNNEVVNNFIKTKLNFSSYEKSLALASTFLENIATLYETFPHFSEVIGHIENLMVLQSRGDKSFYIPPLILGGSPGVGKTFFCNTVSKLVDTHFEVLNMESMTANWILTGSSSQWRDATPGKIFNSLFDRDIKNMNPIFLLDELDKAGGSSNYSVMNSLLPLLERYTAKNFRDECIPLPIDASYIIWIATANDLDKLSAPIRSRFDLFSVPNPTPVQRKSLIKGIYKTVRENNSWGSYFDENLPDDTLVKLANLMAPGAARDLRKSITMACSKAIREDSKLLLPSHIDQYDSGEVMPWNIVL